ncbi:MAG: hypothetical protein EA381_20150 [Planctomycetaceae bacterium]|nr:MAG: hypothetical protein EA381_20150 [Planctomycetaceae bacterium]
MPLFNLLILLAICVIGFGFYRGWFVLASRDAGDDSNQVEVQLTVDPDKARDDAKTVESKARELVSGEEEASSPETPDDNVKRKND